MTNPRKTEYGSITASMFARQMAANILAGNALANVLKGIKPRPLTRREKVARWFRVRRDRVVLAWRVLRGDDIHEDCYY